MFWNAKGFFKKIPNLEMNLKHEMFWNSLQGLGVVGDEVNEP